MAVLKRFHPLLFQNRLRRRLNGTDHPTDPTGEYQVLRALNEGRLEEVREVLERLESDPLVGPDFAASVRAVVAAQVETAEAEQSCVKRCEVDVPLHVWREAARYARVERRSFRRVLSDYLVRGWQESERDQAEAQGGRDAAAREFRAYRQQLEQLLGRVQDAAAAARDAPRAGAPPQATLEELNRSAQANTNALAAVLMVLDAKGWVPRALRAQLQRDRWLP